MLFGFGYLIVRGGAGLARALGAGEFTQHCIRKVLYVPAMMVDPIGATGAGIHELADMAARSGSDAGQAVSDVMTAVVRVDRAASLVRPKAGGGD